MAETAPTPGQPLRLLADDQEDLAVISSVLQDAVATIGDISYEPSQRRLTLALNRFRWEAADGKGGQRVRTALQFGDVLSVKQQRLRQDVKEGVLALLAINFEPGEAPSGVIVLTFAGGGALQAEVECIDAILADLSAPWPTPRRPSHEESESK